MTQDRRRALAVIAVVLLTLQAPAAYALAGPSHDATAGVVYQTNSGLEVALDEEREIAATPFADDATFASEGVSISSLEGGRVSVDSTTFEGDRMAVRQIQATNANITLARDDLSNDVTVTGGATDLILGDVTLDDNTTDFELAAASETTIRVQGIPDTDGIQAVNSNGAVLAGDGDTTDNVADLTFEAGTYQVRLQDGPSKLEIRDLMTQELITETDNGTAIDVEVQFFGDEGSVAVRNTTDGTIDLSGLPIDERFSVSVEAGDSYVQRQIIIQSLLQQRVAYLLPQSTDIETVEPRFLLEDPTRQFDPERSEIVFERPIEINGTTQFVPVAGDRVGLNGFDTILERDQRYRVTVTDPDTGTRREVGEFVPTQSEEVTLTVEDVEFDSEADVAGLQWAARYNEADSGDEVEFIFRDEFETQSLSYAIYERGNESNVLVSGTASGNVTVVEPVPPGEANTVWTVEWETTRGDGETLSATRPVSSDRLPVGPVEFPQQWQTITAMLLLFGVAGLFGAANPGVGGIAVAGTGGLFFMIGWLPDATGGLMVILALFIAVLAYVGRKARGATA